MLACGYRRTEVGQRLCDVVECLVGGPSVGDNPQRPVGVGGLIEHDLGRRIKPGVDVGEFGLDRDEGGDQRVPDGAQVGTSLGALDIVEVATNSQGEQRSHRDQQRECGGEELRRQ